MKPALAYIDSNVSFYVKIMNTRYGESCNCVHVATIRKLGVSKIITADGDFDKVSWIRRIDPKLYG